MGKTLTAPTHAAPTAPNGRPSRPIPPPPPSRNGNGHAGPVTQERRRVTFGQIAARAGHRIVVYGPGGIGKTTLSLAAPGPVAVIDLDDSLPRLAGELEGLDVRPVTGCETWADILAVLQGDGWDGIGTIVIDSATAAEELAVAHTLATVPAQNGGLVNRLEGYGYGKGYQHVYETFLHLLAALDRHAKAGRHVILVCHDCVSSVPNPAGEDYQRWEPRLQSPNSGKASIRLRVREWADHVFFVGYRVETVEGKASGSGERILWPTEQPFCMAKSRGLSEPIAAIRPGATDNEGNRYLTLWDYLFPAPAQE